MKLMLFIKHTGRGFFQDTVLDAWDLELQDVIEETIAVIIIHYRIKREPEKCRQKSFDYYDQRRLRWHESVLTLKLNSL